MKVTLSIVTVLAMCLAVFARKGSEEDWGMKKRARDSDELWGMKKRARDSDELWGMKRARGDSAEDWGVDKRARDSDELWGMKKRARDSDELWGMKRARDSSEDWGMKRAVDSDELWGSKKKRSQCGRQGDSCYSTEGCCKSFVCAVSDEHEMKPEVPGVCLHEKEMTPCTTDQTCRPHERCARLSPSSPTRFCVARPVPPAAAKAAAAVNKPAGAGGLGATCVHSGECQAQTVEGGERLCCQKVTLGRQGSKQICDRVTPSSTCIAK